jgi:cytochrome c5
MKQKIMALALVGILIYSCAPKVAPPPPPPSPAVAKAPEVTVAASNDIAEGKDLYENNCAKCHKLYSPKDYSDQDWLPILERMKKKAQLSDLQHDKIYAYIVSN